MKRFASITVLLLLTMLLLAGTASANQAGAAWANSNRSGEKAVEWDGGDLLRNVPGQLTHTAFQLNTNSCASCHMTHTAAGRNLLIRATTQETCMACHDGTIGFLNVEAPATGTTSGGGMGGSVAAGTFTLVDNRTPSMHNTDDDVTHSGAPGGDRASTTAPWNTNFTCASCHAPHGSHSIRLLHLNPNNIAGRDVASSVYGVAGGRRILRAGVDEFTFDNVTWSPTRNVYVYDSVYAAAYAAPWVAGTVRIFHDTSNPTVALSVYFTVNLATGEVMQTATQRSELQTRLAATPFNLTGAALSGARFDLDVGRGLRVRALANTDYLGDLVRGAREIDFIDPSTYDAPAYNLFCAACHTDYLPLSSPSDQGSGAGMYAQKIRHTIDRGASGGTSSMPVRGTRAFSGNNLTGSIGPSADQNRLMCLSCHFAHGADASMMLLADNTRVSAGTGGSGTPTDANQNDVSGSLTVAANGGVGSSALKRYINQASCWHCHVRHRSTVFQNTDYFWQTFPQGLTW